MVQFPISTCVIQEQQSRDHNYARKIIIIIIIIIKIINSLV